MQKEQWSWWREVCADEYKILAPYLHVHVHTQTHKKNKEVESDRNRAKINAFHMHTACVWAHTQVDTHKHLHTHTTHKHLITLISSEMIICHALCVEIILEAIYSKDGSWVQLGVTFLSSLYSEKLRQNDRLSPGIWFSLGNDESLHLENKHINQCFLKQKCKGRESRSLHSYLFLCVPDKPRKRKLRMSF